jgi:hypothetical protein
MVNWTTSKTLKRVTMSVIILAQHTFLAHGHPLRLLLAQKAPIVMQAIVNILSIYLGGRLLF